MPSTLLPEAQNLQADLTAWRRHLHQHPELSGREEQTAEDPGEPDRPLAELVEREKARVVRGALARVPDGHRQVLVLRFTHDLSLEEIAASTGHPLGTVKSHLFRGLKRLRRLLDEESTS